MVVSWKQGQTKTTMVWIGIFPRCFSPVGGHNCPVKKTPGASAERLDDRKSRTVVARDLGGERWRWELQVLSRFWALKCVGLLSYWPPTQKSEKKSHFGFDSTKIPRDSVKIPDDMDALDVKAPPENIWITWVGNHVGNIWWFEARAFCFFLIFLHCWYTPDERVWCFWNFVSARVKDGYQVHQVRPVVDHCRWQFPSGSSMVLLLGKSSQTEHPTGKLNMK